MGRQVGFCGWFLKRCEKHHKPFMNDFSYTFTSLLSFCLMIWDSSKRQVSSHVTHLAILRCVHKVSLVYILGELPHRCQRKCSPFSQPYSPSNLSDKAPFWLVAVCAQPMSPTFWIFSVLYLYCWKAAKRLRGHFWLNLPFTNLREQKYEWWSWPDGGETLRRKKTPNIQTRAFERFFRSSADLTWTKDISLINQWVSNL